MRLLKPNYFTIYQNYPTGLDSHAVSCKIDTIYSWQIEYFEYLKRISQELDNVNPRNRWYRRRIAYPFKLKYDTIIQFKAQRIIYVLSFLRPEVTNLMQNTYDQLVKGLYKNKYEALTTRKANLRLEEWFYLSAGNRCEINVPTLVNGKLNHRLGWFRCRATTSESADQWMSHTPPRGHKVTAPVPMDGYSLRNWQLSKYTNYPHEQSQTSQVEAR